MRGKQSEIGESIDATGGSSPHAWETVEASPNRMSVPRFIPTCVGNRGSSVSSLRAFSVHPHMRGKQVNMVCFVIMYSGSSPHAWETV